MLMPLTAGVHASRSIWYSLPRYYDQLLPYEPWWLVRADPDVYSYGNYLNLADVISASWQAKDETRYQGSLWPGCSYGLDPRACEKGLPLSRRDCLVDSETRLNTKKVINIEPIN
jgi:hypothetical protein